MKQYFVYFMTNINKTTLYVGVTNDIERRVYEHKNSINPYCFTTKYKCFLLVWFEEYNDINQAIAREKQIKNWKREWKNNTINEINPKWTDLAETW